MSPKPRPKSPPSASKPGPRPAPARTKAPASTKAPTRAKATAPSRGAATRPRVPFGWVIAGAVAASIVAIAVIVALGSGGGSSSPGTSSAPASAQLVRNTKAAGVPLLDQEGVATHTHTTLVVMVNGTRKEVPAFIGIDTQSGKIAALHTHDTSGLVHLESAKENDSYTLGQFLTVWGMPKDAAGRCTFFGAKSPCTLSVTSKDSGAVGLDVKLADYDTLTLTVTSA